MGADGGGVRTVVAYYGCTGRKLGEAEAGRLAASGGLDLGDWWDSMSTCLLIGCDERTSQSDIDALTSALSSWIEGVSP